MGVGLIFSLLVLLPSTFMYTNTRADTLTPPASSDNTNEDVYIVYLSERPPTLNPHDYYIKLLYPILGSEKAANESLVFSYQEFDGFAAKLTVEQVNLLKKQPGVMSVEKDKIYTPNDHINS